ncbi:MAG: carboxypeptidase regulatory-like domain-containing protein [Candidatus Kapabacteria bacterium]|nr:carboxypeptidase regulatory-like domain-containing protein [Ignavibacteriota bacterium]MCW5883599.1 carboxypeptidase regulatory-like domain-containing protein [Candidatus Kapabacteria bacterium]
MFKRLLKSSNWLTLTIALVFGISSFGYAQNQLKPVDKVNVQLMGGKKGEIYIADGFISWFYPNDEKTATGFNIYIAEGKSEDIKDFQFFDKVSREDALGRDQYHFKFSGLESKKNGWSFVVKATNNNGAEGAVREYVFAELRNSNTPVHKIIFTSKPLLHIGLNETYTYTPEIETNIEEAEFIYSLVNSPEDVEFDSQTGELVWQPKKSGLHHFKIEVKAIAGDKIIASAVQTWSVMVKECSELATVSGTVNDVDGNSIKMGMISVFSYSDNNGRLNKSFVFNARFENGIFEIPNLDKGEYYILVEAFSMNNTTAYYPTWYDNAINFDDAKPIEIDCGDEIELAFIIKEIPKPKMYKVSGKVVDADDFEPVRNGVVEFRGEDINSGKMIGHTFKLNQNGTFEGKLPDSFIYKAVASGVYFSNDQNRPQAYFPQFYELADNPTDAKSIMLTDDRTDIDFYLVKVPNYENNIYGTVVDIEDNPLEGIEVTAFLVNSDGKFVKYIYMGKSSITDEFGNYKIENLIPGDYVILARPHSRTLSPGFYVEDDISTLSWQEATRVSVDEEGSHGSYQITLTLIERNGGKGIVRGNVGRDKKGFVNSKDDPSDAILGASVYLVNAKNNVTHSLSTDEFGKFELNNVAEGTYTLVLDKIGYQGSKTEITIGDGNVVEKDMEMSPVDVTSVNDEITFGFEVYPNPATDFVNVQIEQVNTESRIILYNNTGIEVLRLNALTGNIQSINTSELPAGSYFLKVLNGNDYSIKPIIIIK